MKFSKNIFFLLSLTLVFIACDPLEEVYEEIDEIEAKQDSTVAEFAGVELDHTLSAEDYAEIADLMGSATDADYVSTYNAFSSTSSASEYIETFLTDLYSDYGNGTAVFLTYNSYLGDFSSIGDEYLEVSSYEDAIIEAGNYTLESEDYENLGIDAITESGFFMPSYSADSYINDILSAEVQGVEAGDIYSVTYEYSTENAVYDYSTAGYETVYNETFESDLSGVTLIDVSGEDAYYWQQYVDGCATISPVDGSYDPVANEDWLITPAIDLADIEGAELQFLQVMNYLDGDPADFIDVLVSTDFDGADQTSANWTEFEVDVWPAGDSWSDIASTIDISDFDGQTVYIAFVLNTTTVLDGLTWEIGEITVRYATEATLTSREPMEVTSYYEYDGSEWDMLDAVYDLNADDYDAMGAPGTFNNFSSSVAPEDYLPSYLATKYPYAQEGDTELLVYKYYDDSVSTLADTYKFSESEWGLYEVDVELEEKTIKYQHDGTSFNVDPSLTTTLTSDDYQMIVDYVGENISADYVDEYGTGESLYGANSYYENFDIRVSEKSGQEDYSGLSGDEAAALALQRAGEGVLVWIELNYGDATVIEGFDEILYTITFDTYDGEGGQYYIIYELVDTGTFELVEGPTAVE